MELTNEVKEALFLMNRSERAEVVIRLINEGFCDPETAFDTVGVDITYDDLCDKAEMNADDEYSIIDRVDEISTDNIAEYVNAKMREML